MEVATSYKDGTIIKGVDAALERLEIIIRTEMGTFSPDPAFGASLDTYVDEPNTRNTPQAVYSKILRATRKYCPDIEITKLNIYSTDGNRLSVEITILYAQESGTKTFQFSL